MTEDTTQELTQEEQALLEECTTVIHGHLDSFIPMGKALLTIKDKKLYRGTPGMTFERYTFEVFNFDNRQTAYNYIHAYLVHAAIAGQGYEVVPTVASQCRPLYKYVDTNGAGTPELYAVWEHAVGIMQKSGKKRVTVAMVNSAIDARRAPAVKPPSGAGGLNEDEGTDEEVQASERVNLPPEVDNAELTRLRAALLAAKQENTVLNQHNVNLSGELLAARSNKGVEDPLFKSMLKAGYRVLVQQDKDKARIKEINQLFAQFQ